MIRSSLKSFFVFLFLFWCSISFETIVIFHFMQMSRYCEFFCKFIFFLSETLFFTVLGQEKFSTLNRNEKNGNEKVLFANILHFLWNGSDFVRPKIPGCLNKPFEHSCFFIPNNLSTLFYLNTIKLIKRLFEFDKNLISFN